MRIFILKIAIFCAFLSLYLFSVGIPFKHTDGQVMYESARAIGLDHQLDIAPSLLPQVIVGHDGKSYSKYDPGMAVLAAPVVAYADQVAIHEKAHRYAVAAVFVLLVPACGMALGIASLFSIATHCYPLTKAVMISAVAGLGTMAWPYAGLFFAEAILAGLLIFAIALLVPLHPISQKKPRSLDVLVRLGVASGALGFAIFTRASMMIYLPAFYYFIWQITPSEQKIRGRWQAWARLGLFTLGPCIAILSLLYHNHVRFGSLLDTGYGDEGFSTFPLIGMMGLLVSSGKSVFIYAPPLVLSALLWPRFRRKNALLANTILMMSLIALAYYGTWWAWHGGWVWGPRFLVPLMPLWCLAWGELPARWFWYGLASILFLAGIGVQILGTFTNSNLLYFEAFAGASDPDDISRYAMVHYDLDYWPLARAWEQARQGHWEKQAIYALDGTDLTAKWADGIPRTVHRMMLVSCSVIVVLWVSAWTQKDRRYVGNKTEI